MPLDPNNIDKDVPYREQFTVAMVECALRLARRAVAMRKEGSRPLSDMKDPRDRSASDYFEITLDEWERLTE